jgi:photosystem II stability/assembly factor-like uncharacterized protein
MQGLRLSVFWRVAALAVLFGCHRAGEEGLDTLVERKISIADKFFDVQAISAERAIVVGYGGKILLTENGGTSWERIPSGVDKALYNVKFVDDRNGWISGQEGIILHSKDGGRTWERQKSEASVYLFGLDFIDAREGWVVGDRATTLHTVDGGANWRVGKLGMTQELSADEELLAADPVLYGVDFVDADTGWIVGELGNIFHTADGGRTWKAQQESLLGGGIYNPLDLPTFFGVHFIDRVNGAAAGLEGKIARTRDGGATWAFESLEVDVPFVDPLFQPFLFPDGGGWAVGAAGEVVRKSGPEGAWQRASLGMEILTWLRAIDFFDEQNGWIVGGYGLILHTTDGGKSWLPAIG